MSTRQYLLSLMILAAGLQGKTIVVDKAGGGDYTTIRGAEAVVTPGDIVLVKDGQYDEDVIINVNGTADSRIVFKTENKHGARAKRFMLIADYITVDGFELTGTAGAGVTNSKSYNRITNCRVHDIPNCAIQAGTHGYVAHNLIERVILGVKLGSNSVAEYNRIVNLTEQTLPGVFNGFTWFLGDSITIRYNYMWNDTLIGDFFRTWDEGGNGPSYDILMDGNICFGAMHASEPTATDQNLTARFTYCNNLFVNTYYVGVCTQYLSDVKILNNTFINCGAYPVWFQNSPNGGNVVKNNLFAYYGNPLLGSGKDRGVRSDGVHPPDCDYNIYYNTKMYRSPGSNEQIIDPQFISPAPFDTNTFDFSLSAGSPAVDAGTEVGLAMDVLGNGRIGGSAPDIGCYEYHASGIAPHAAGSRNDVSISPFPVKDMMTVNSDENLDLVMILDMSGRPVWKKSVAGTSLQLNIKDGGLTPGNYFLLSGSKNHLTRFTITE